MKTIDLLKSTFQIPEMDKEERGYIREKTTNWMKVSGFLQEKQHCDSKTILKMLVVELERPHPRRYIVSRLMGKLFSSLRLEIFGPPSLS